MAAAMSATLPPMMSRPQAKPWISAITPYVPGKAAAGDGRPLIKLSANENPLGTSTHAVAALAARAGGVARYPDPDAVALRQAIAQAHGLDPARVVCGTGSDELLNLAAQAYAGPGDEVIYVRFGFSVYDIAARRCGATPVVVADRDYGTDVDAVLAAVTPATRVVFIANPNNPTGTLAGAAEIARLHAGLPADVLFVLDQAYAEYLDPADADAGLALAAAQNNVLVTRTFSKIYGLAAERIGWATGALEVIATLNRIRGPFNVTDAGQAAAVAALDDQGFVGRSRDHNRKWRDWLAGEIMKLGNHGLSVVPSAANFILILFNGAVSAEYAYNALIDGGYIVRWLPGQGLPHALRITIGSESDNRAIARIIAALVRGDGQ